MTYRIVPIAESHIAGFHAVCDAVFRDSRMHACLEAPPLEEVAAFVRANLADGETQLVALHGSDLVGWCDVLAKPRPAMRHGGTLGIGVLREHRGRGVGSALLRTALQAARARGLIRVELTVRCDNHAARRLYERFGFVTEGTMRKQMRIDGRFYDGCLMALICE